MATATETKLVKDPFGDGLIPANHESDDDESTSRKQDTEILTMARIIREMSALPADARRRVGAWVADRYGAK